MIRAITENGNPALEVSAVHELGIRPALWLKLEAEAPVATEAATTEARVYVKDMHYDDWNRFPGSGYYTGYTLNGKPEDNNGKLRDALDNVYAGCWKNGILTGQGTITLNNGDKYVGGLLNGSMHGQGTYTYASGNKYVGVWKDDKFNGYGTYYNADGTIWHQGQWKDNEFMG